MAAYFTTGLADAAFPPPAPPEIPFPGVCEVSRFAFPQVPDLDQCPLDEAVPDADLAARALSSIPSPAVEPSLVLALYHPARGGGARHFGYEVAKTGVKSIHVLGEGHDLSRVALDGEVMLAAHGLPGQLSDGESDIPVSSVLAALTDPLVGLPKGFHGTISLVACHAGEDPVPARPSLDTVGQYLRLGGVSDACAKEITDTLIRSRTVSPEFLVEVRARIRKDAVVHPFPGRRTEDQIMAVFTRVVQALHLDLGSVARQIAAGLTAAGYEGGEVTGPKGQTMAFMTPEGMVLEVAHPGSDPARVLNLIHDLADFHFGSSSDLARKRLLAMGVNPADYGAGRTKAPRTPRLASARPGTDLVAHATQWVDDYRTFTRFAHETLLTLDCTEATGLSRVFLPHSERFVRVRVGAAQGGDGTEPGPSSWDEL